MLKSKAFLDTNILLSALQGDARTAPLFEQEAMNRHEYFINPVVLQELYFAAERFPAKADISEVTRDLKMIDVDPKSPDRVLKELGRFRNRLAHTNEILILGSAMTECDYLVTLDKDLLAIGQVGSLRIVSPEEILQPAEVHK